MDDRLEGSSFLTDIPNHVPNRVPDAIPECANVLERRFMVRVPEVQGLQLLSMLRSFRERGLLFDFTVRVQGRSFPCHRCVIAACSDFFRAMFEVDMRERDDRTVTLGNQSAAAVSAFLDFAYSGETVVTDSNVDMLFQLSSFLQVSVLSKACSDFLMGTLDLSNCLTLLALAEGYGSAPLLQRANEFVLQNFHQLALSVDFLDMQVNMLEVCLQSDALSVPSEEAVMMSLLRWVGHDLQGRRSLLPRLLGLVRLHHLPAETLKALCVSEALLQENEGCVQMLDEASARQRQFGGLLGDARPSTTHSYIYVHKTEENGEIHHAFCYLLEADQWRELPRSPVVAMVPDPPGCYLCAYAEQMFVTGGCRGNCCRAVRLHVAEAFHEATDEVWRFCPVSRTYTPASPMGKPRTMHVAVNALNRLYVIGGRTRGPRDGAPPLLEVEFYDPLSCTWSTVSPLPTAIYYPEASACGGTIYTLGSQVEITDSFNPSLDCFYQYRVAEDQWSRLVAEFGQFFHATLVKAVAINDTLHLCDLSTYKVYSFCPETCVWKGQGSFECAGFNAGAVGSKDKIYILGGDYSPDEITDEVQVYQSGRSQWEEVAPMPRALTEFHCQIISFNSDRDPWWLEEDTT